MISKNQMLRKQTQNKPKQSQNKPNYSEGSFDSSVGLKFPRLLEQFDFGLCLLFAEQLFELGYSHPFNTSIQPHHDVAFSNEELIILTAVSQDCVGTCAEFNPRCSILEIAQPDILEVRPLACEMGFGGGRVKFIPVPAYLFAEMLHRSHSFGPVDIVSYVKHHRDKYSRAYNHNNESYDDRFLSLVHSKATLTDKRFFNASGGFCISLRARVYGGVLLCRFRRPTGFHRTAESPWDRRCIPARRPWPPTNRHRRHRQLRNFAVR